MCVIHNRVKDNGVVYGGGSAEIACVLAVNKKTSNACWHYKVHVLVHPLQVPDQMRMSSPCAMYK